jgi:hypothetical protein
MKKVYMLLTLALAVSSANAQVIFSSDLSDWSAGSPTDFFGSKTQFTTAEVSEETTGAVYGDSYIRCTNTTSTHKRLSTQPLSIESGQEYIITFYAKGQGEIRTGLFDDHTPTSTAGFLTYNSYIVVNSSSWTMYSQSITASNTTSSGEFILSIRNTVAPNHMEIDSVSIVESSGGGSTPGSYSIPFHSDLSDWTGSSLNDFMGSKTQTTDLTVTEVTSGASAGTSYARLATTGTAHRRFSTQPMAVVNGQGYEIKFWAKGQGSIRTGLFDDHTPTSSAGFTTYNSYIAVNTTTWTEYTQTITATNTTSVGEFIFSVQNTVAPNHIEIDSVSIIEVTIAPPATVSVYDIQYTTDPSGDSPYKDQIVNTGGIVTAIRNDGRYWIKSGNGPWSGIYVYHQPTTPVQLGDSVTMSATVVEYFNLTELSFINNFTVVSSGNFFMANTVTTNQANTEAYEGCLIRVINANCITGLNSFNEWVVNDGSGQVKVDDFLYAFTPSVGTAYNVTGVMDFSFSEYKILPRDANDISLATTIIEKNPNSFTLYPNPVHDYLFISFGDTEVREVSIKDISGKLITHQLVNGTETIDVSSFDSGIYLITIGNNTQKFIKN